MPKMESPAMAIVLERMNKSVKPAKAPEADMSMEPEESDSMDNQDEGEMACCEEMMGAIENKDPRAFKEALKSFLECCC